MKKRKTKTAKKPARTKRAAPVKPGPRKPGPRGKKQPLFGYTDEGGAFHPLRNSPGYNARLTVNPRPGRVRVTHPQRNPKTATATRVMAALKAQGSAKGWRTLLAAHGGRRAGQGLWRFGDGSYIYVRDLGEKTSFIVQ